MRQIGSALFALLTFRVFVGCTSTPPSRTADAQPLGVNTTPILIRNVRLFDGDKVIPSTDVLIENGKIAAVGSSITTRNHTNIVDGTSKTLLPGLIDAHCHTWNPEQLKQAAVFGVTTELDMMSVPSRIKTLKDALRSANLLDAADLRSAGNPFTVPRGHGTEYGFPVATLTEPSEATPFISARVAEGSDYIKFMYDSGAAWGQKRPSLSLQLLRAGIAAAHQKHVMALVHAGTSAETMDAVEAGADGIQHVWADHTSPQLLDAIQRRHLFVVPTLSVLLATAGEHPGDELANDPMLQPYLSQSATGKLYAAFSVQEEIVPATLLGNVRKLYLAKVPLFAGTDAGNSGVDHGATVHGELRLLTSAGMTPIEALKSATSAPADAFHLEDRGRIAQGKRADLVLVDGDPTTNIFDTRRIASVFIQGRKVDRDSYRALQAKRKRPRLPHATPKLFGDFEPPLGGKGLGEGWEVSTDEIQGGVSKATLSVETSGAESTDHALLLKGNVTPSHVAFPWSGAFYSAGQSPMQPVDLSAYDRISFYAKGDGARYQVMLFVAGETLPQIQTYVTSSDWQKFSFEFRRFGTLGHGIKGIFFGTGRPGSYQFSLDRVTLE